MFKMHSNETITQMFARFNTITNDPYGLGKSYTSTKLVNKILRSLPKAHQIKVVAIQEVRDLSKLPLEELMGSLMTHGILMRDHDKDEEEEKKKKTIALKSSTQEEEEEDLSDSELDDIALLTRRYKKYLSFKKGNNLKKYSKGNFSKEYPKGITSKERKGKDEVMCFECKNPRHMKNECPLKIKNKKKAMKATWDDESERELDEEVQEEIANMCFMAIDIEVKCLDNDDLLDDEFDEKPSYDELLDDFNDLHMKYEKLALKNDTLKKKIFSLTKELEDSLK